MRTICAAMLKRSLSADINTRANVPPPVPFVKCSGFTTTQPFTSCNNNNFNKNCNKLATLDNVLARAVNSEQRVKHL